MPRAAMLAASGLCSLCFLSCAFSMGSASTEVRAADVDQQMTTLSSQGNLSKHSTPCVWPSKYAKYKIKDHVYNICGKDAAQDGLSNKNAADTIGELAFIFGRIGTHTGPRGLRDYYESGVIQIVHVAVDEWGAYLQCNHTGKTYHCGFDPDVKRPHHADKVHAGREKNWHSVGYWYSFPKAGRNIHWMQGHGGDEHCGLKVKKAKCVLDRMIESRGCDRKQCTSKHERDLWKCAACMKSHGFDKLQEHWDHAVWQHCPDINMDMGTQMLQDITV